MNTTVDKLNSFLRGEISAVETYRQAIAKLGNTSEAPTLNDCMQSHAQRVRALEQEVRRRGGQPAQSSGPWGTFAKLVEGSATAIGEKAAIAALEEGEDHGRNDYKRELSGLEPDARSFVEQQLLPEQLRTHNALSALKKSLS